jgi:hypothetical protein
MCAMLCALHRDRRTQVPSDRLELYRIALETLLDRRDIERRVKVVPFSLSLPQKLILLQDVAHWLMLNDQSDATTDDVIKRITLRLPSLRGVHEPPEEIFGYLHERSGLLREPVVGRIDFLHRTFQEYLAAMEAVDQNNISMLIEKATDDQWREVIILACGHASSEQREKLIGGLLDKGNEDQDNKHVLHLIAVACLETAVRLDTPLVRKVQAALQGLVPPMTMAEAKSLASAGDLAVPALKGHSKDLVNPTAACVRALSLIGTEAALQALAEYGADKRKMVFKELLRAWPDFDTERYANLVLSKSPRLAEGFHSSDVLEIAATRFLSRFTPVSAAFYGTSPPLDILEGNRNIVSLDFSYARDVKDITALGSIENLAVLDLDGCVGIEDFGALRSCSSLRRISLSATNFGPNLQILPRQGNLLRLVGMGVERLESLEGIEHQAQLVTLRLRRYLTPNQGGQKRDGELRPVISDWELVANLTKLVNVSIIDGAFPGLHLLQGSNGLEELSVSHGKTIGQEIGAFEQLNDLTVGVTASLNEDAWRALAELKRIRSVTVGDPGGRDLGHYPRSLRKLAVRESGLVSLDQGPPSLVDLRFSDCSSLETLGDLSGLKRLQLLRLSGLPEDLDLRPLEDLPGRCRMMLDGEVLHRLPESLQDRVAARFIRQAGSPRERMILVSPQN